MKKIIFIFSVIFVLNTSVFASYIKKFSKDFEKNTYVPEAKGGIYPTDNVNFQRLLKKHGIMKLCAEYSINLRFAQYARVYRNYYVLPHTNSSLNNLDKQLKIISQEIKKYTKKFLGKLKITLYIARGFSYRPLAGLASGRKIILGRASSRTLHHEIGHIVHNTYYSDLRLWRTTFWKGTSGGGYFRKPKGLKRENFVSLYAMTNYREDWAETYAALITYNPLIRYNYVNLKNETNLKSKIREKIGFMKKMFEKMDGRYNYRFWAFFIKTSNSRAIAFLNTGRTTTVAVNNNNRRNNNVNNSGRRNVQNTAQSGSVLSSSFGDGITSDGSENNQETSNNNRKKTNTRKRYLNYYSKLLLVAVYKNDYSLVTRCISSGANVNYANSSNWTALHYAAYRGNVKIISYLVNKGANVNAVTFNGNTPPQIAKRYSRNNAYNYFVGLNAKSNKGSKGRRYYGNRYYNKGY